MRLFVRLSLLGLVALVAFGFWLNGNQGTPEPDSPVSVQSGQCENPGISVVVDFGKASTNRTVEKCVSSFTGNSWNLLRSAGFDVRGTEKYPEAFVCRIDMIPDLKSEKCISTPGSTSGSWAYFLAEPGSEQWVYSNYGAANHIAVCGSAEGWRFLSPDEEIDTPPTVKPVTTNCEK